MSKKIKVLLGLVGIGATVCIGYAVNKVWKSLDYDEDDFEEFDEGEDDDEEEAYNEFTDEFPSDEDGDDEVEVSEDADIDDEAIENMSAEDKFVKICGVTRQQAIEILAGESSEARTECEEMSYEELANEYAKYMNS